MWRTCTRTLVRGRKLSPCDLVKSYHFVKPVSATMVPGRCLTHQKDLPSQPIPPLQQTCKHYLSILESIVEVDELKRTKELVEEFQKAGGVGERLQRCLEKRARNTKNWSTDYLVRTDYLDNRNPLVGYSNVGCVCPQLPFSDKQGQMRYAAKMIAAVLESKTMIDNETLPVEYLRGKPLCMQQYSQVLSSCRIPGLKTDSLVFHAKSSNPPKHITVVHNSQFFVVEVYDSDRTPLTVDQLCVQLERICNSSSETNMEPVGLLTTLHRDSWSKAYVKMNKDKTNKESMSAIERSLCTVCLDKAVPRMSDEMYRSCAGLQVMHGGGSHWNSGNRWFDKTMQIIIGEDGTNGFNSSHAAIDGTCSMAIIDRVMASMKKPEMTQSPVVPLPMPQKLHFNIPSDIKKEIEEAKQKIDILAQDLDLTVTVFDHFGRNYVKAHKRSADSFIQMAIQLAYNRMHQRCGSSYEAASLRMFRQGRVATISSTTRESVSFVKGFDDPQKQNTEKVFLLEKAMKTHSWNTNMAISGQDADVHLIGLKMQAVEEKIQEPEIFTDISYEKFLLYQFTTSQVLSKTNCLPISGPGHHERYNICYSVMDNDITFAVTAFKSSKENNAAQLSQAIGNALLDMRVLLEQTPKANYR